MKREDSWLNKVVTGVHIPVNKIKTGHDSNSTTIYLAKYIRDNQIVNQSAR
jgi:hypothetical protein